MLAAARSRGPVSASFAVVWALATDVTKPALYAGNKYRPHCNAHGPHRARNEHAKPGSCIRPAGRIFLVASAPLFRLVLVLGHNVLHVCSQKYLFTLHRLHTSQIASHRTTKEKAKNPPAGRGSRCPDIETPWFLCSSAHSGCRASVRPHLVLVLGHKVLQVAHELHVVERAAAVALARIVLQTAPVKGDRRRVLNGEYLELQLLARAGRLRCVRGVRERARHAHRRKTTESLR
jgi:hypothetical protein